MNRAVLRDPGLREAPRRRGQSCHNPADSAGSGASAGASRRARKVQRQAADMAPRTRLDRLVWFRERREEAALVQLAGAERRLAEAREELGRRAATAGADARGAGDAALWAMDDAARRRALQAVTTASHHVREAAGKRDAARADWTAAHQHTEAAMRIADRRRTELRADLARRERRDADEVAGLRFARAGR